MESGYTLFFSGLSIQIFKVNKVVVVSRAVFIDNDIYL